VGEGEAVLHALRGDCHAHTTWSDGGAPLRDMAETAIAIGHDWMAITDHSARLAITHGLSEERLTRQLDEMTGRMVMAVANPHADVLGHCPNRKLAGRGRPPSEFDPEIVFAACAQFDTAVEINCRPERQDPPEDLLGLAVQWECKIAINTDAHATGQLEWQPYGADKAVRRGVPADDIINTWSADELLAWPTSHSS
jgi:putative hydrolase